MQDENTNIYTTQVRFCAIKSGCGSTQNEINVNGKDMEKVHTKVGSLPKNEEPTNLCERAMIPKNGVPGPSTQQAKMHEP